MDFVNVLDPGPEGVAEILERAASVKADPGAVAGRLAGRNVGLFFEKPSLRTRVSCERACTDLGAIPLTLKQDEIGLKKREAVKDVAKVLDRYFDLLAFRVFDHADLVTLADDAEAPVVNLLSDLEHPCQALADLQTLAEHRPLEGATLAFIGDGNNVCRSLMLAGLSMGVSVRIATPERHGPSPGCLEAAAGVARMGAGLTVTHDPTEAVAGADAVYTDVWTSMGQEAEAEGRRALFRDFQVNEALFGLAAPDAIFLHCLPAHRGEEVTDGVMDHERSRVYDQAENRMHAFKALLLHLAG